MRKLIVILVIALLVTFLNSAYAAPATQPSPLYEKIKNAPARTWIEIPDSALLSVAPKEGQFPKTWGVCGPAGVVMAWGGAAYDSKRERLVVWGGGHSDYHGNEIYVFDVKQMTWQRLNDPLADPVNDQEVNADGSPNSRHTYGGLAYLTHEDRFFALGGSLAGKGFAQCDRTWTYDFDANKWQDRQPTGTAPGGGFCLGCAYDAQAHLIYFGSERGLFAYDYAQNHWKQLDGNPADHLGFAIDPEHGLLVGVGNGRVIAYDLAHQNFKPITLKTSGAEPLLRNTNAAGFDFDPVSGHLVAWGSWVPQKVYVLDLDKNQWDAIDAAGAPKKAPFAENGVWGRWRYVPSLNAFIAVSDAGGNVYFYKLTDGTGEKR